MGDHCLVEVSLCLWSAGDDCFHFPRVICYNCVVDDVDDVDDCSDVDPGVVTSEDAIFHWRFEIMCKCRIIPLIPGIT